MADSAHTTHASGTRRDFLMLTTGAAGAVAVGAVVVPLISQLAPDAQTIAAGAPIDVDLAPIAEGQAIKLFWRGKPIFVRHRTKKEIEEAKAVDVATLRDPQTDAQRTKAGHEQFLVVFGNCTHLGCIPLGIHEGDNRGEYGGYFCPCHGSVYDTAARIRKGPAPKNLFVPDYKFTSATTVTVG